MLSVSTWMIISVYHVFCGPPVINYHFQQAWGSLPNFKLCAFKGSTVKFAFYNIHMSTKMREAVVNTRNPDDLTDIDVTVIPGGVHTTDEACLEFGTHILKPNPSNIELTIDFSVTFELEQGEAGSDTFPYVARNFELYAVNRHEMFAGTLAFPDMRPITDDAYKLNVVKLFKKKWMTSLDDSSTYSSSVHDLTVEKKSISLPKKRPEGPTELLSTVEDPNAEDLYMSLFEVYRPAPSGTSVGVDVYNTTSMKERLFVLVGTLGGALTVIGYAWSVIFPHKYPRSNVRATYNMRTMLWARRKDQTNVVVSSDRSEFGMWSTSSFNSPLSSRKSEVELAATGSSQINQTEVSEEEPPYFSGGK